MKEFWEENFANYGWTELPDLPSCVEMNIYVSANVCYPIYANDLDDTLVKLVERLVLRGRLTPDKELPHVLKEHAYEVAQRPLGPHEGWLCEYQEASMVQQQWRAWKLQHVLSDVVEDRGMVVRPKMM